MSFLLKKLSLTGLALTIVPSLLVFTQTISFELHKTLMVVGMVLWFATSPFWMKGKSL